VTQVSPIFNLGAPGLAGTLRFEVYLQPTYDDIAVPVSAVGVTVAPRPNFAAAATGNYQLTGLPDPVPGGYGTVFIYSAAGDLLSKFEYSSPPLVPLVLFRAETVIVNNGRLTSADTIGTIQLGVIGLPDPTTAAIDFSVKTAAGVYVIQDRPAAANSIQLLSDGSYSFTLSYALEVGYPLTVTSPIGTVTMLYGEFRVDYGAGRVKCVPGDNSLVLRVKRAVS